jgi:hypothetical protein
VVNQDVAASLPVRKTQEVTAPVPVSGVGDSEPIDEDPVVNPAEQNLGEGMPPPDED